MLPVPLWYRSGSIMWGWNSDGVAAHEPPVSQVEKLANIISQVEQHIEQRMNTKKPLLPIRGGEGAHEVEATCSERGQGCDPYPVFGKPKHCCAGLSC